MSRPYPGEDFDDAADRLADEDVQRGVDDRSEAQLAAAKRNAAGVSAEQLSLQDAFMEGQRAGAHGFGASMNKYQDFTPEHAEWERGRISTLGKFMGRAA